MAMKLANRISSSMWANGVVTPRECVAGIQKNPPLPSFLPSIRGVQKSALIFIERIKKESPRDFCFLPLKLISIRVRSTYRAVLAPRISSLCGLRACRSSSPAAKRDEAKPEREDSGNILYIVIANRYKRMRKCAFGPRFYCWQLRFAQMRRWPQ